MTNLPRPTWIPETLNAATWDVLRPYVVIGAAALITLASCTMGYSEPAPGRESDKPIASSRARISQAADANGNAVIIGRRPPGCPHRYCGCYASLEVFGKIKPHLNLAKNWLQFPRTSPAPGMVAARPGHVFVLLDHVQGDEWLVKDGNSGGGLTRQHVRSISRYRVVNPYGSYAGR